MMILSAGSPTMAGESDMPATAIVTDYWAKPIPIRAFDWSAVRDGYEPGDPVGVGRTKEEAVADLLEQEEAKQ